MATNLDKVCVDVDGVRRLDRIRSAAATRRAHSSLRTARTPLLKDTPTVGDKLPRPETGLQDAAPALTGPLTDQVRDEIQDRRWQELSCAVSRDWPGCPQPLDDRAVVRRLEALAAQVSTRLPTVRRQMIDDASAVLLLAFGKFKQSRPFKPWARKVMYHYGVSLLRRQTRMRVDSPFVEAVTAPLTPSAEEDLVEVLRDFRRLSDRIRFPPRTGNGPDLAAVFALETRLRLLAILVRRGPDFLDLHLPLRDQERALRVRDGWPTLGELWGWLRDPAEAGLLNIDAVRKACSQLAPSAPVADLHKVWNNWLHRAKGIVSGQIESDIQGRLFFYLFPRLERSR